MALPSQSSRGVGPRARVSRSRSRSGPGRVIGLFVIGALLVAGVWAFWPSASSAPGDDGGDSATLAAAETDANPSDTLPAGTRSLGADAPTRAPERRMDSATGGRSSEPRARDTVSVTSSSLADALENAARTQGSGGSSAPAANASPDRVASETSAPTRSTPRAAPRAVDPPVDTTRPPGGTTATALVDADALIERGQLAQAAGVLNSALLDATTESDRRRLRTKLSELNRTLIFSPRVTPGMWMTESYTVQSGDTLERITRNNDLGVDHRLIARVNNISDPSKIRVDQTLKLVRGPFHAHVFKAQYRMDIYHGAPDEPEEWMYVRSFAVGLGEHDGTPTGLFRVRRESKLVNPQWINPRTGEHFGADNPLNPIGERWIGLEGIGEAARFTGYGIHGTIEPDSIGSQASMGCVRLHNDDVELVFELLAEGVSVVLIED